MGLFSSKRKTVVNTSTSRLIDDKDIPDIGTSAVYDYLFNNTNNRNNFVDIDRSYAESLVVAQNNSIATKLNVARRWAERKYVYGVPVGNMLDPDQIDLSNLMDEYLTRTLGKQVRIVYAKFGPTNALHMGWQRAIDILQYDAASNELKALSAQVPYPVYLDDIKPVYSKWTIQDMNDPESFAQWGIAPSYGKTRTRIKDLNRKQTPYTTDDSISSDMIEITFEMLDEQGKPFIRPYRMDLLNYEWSGAPPTAVLDDSDTNNIEPEAQAPTIEDNRAEKDYIMVQYFTQAEDGTEVLGIFTYEYGSNLISELEDLFTVRKQLGRYYPNIYMRLDGKNLASEDEIGTTEYKSSKALCNKLSLDYKSVSDQIHEAVGSVGDVTQILISTQIPVNTDDDLIKEYLFNYFYAMYNQLPDKFADTAYSSLNQEYVNGYAKVGLTSQIKDEVYESRITFNTIGYVDEEKVIGPVGTVTSLFQTKEVYNKRGLASLVRSMMPYHKFTKQITATTCRTITVFGLASTQVVRGGYTTTCSGDDENLILPLDDSIARGFNYKERTLIYSKSLRVIINTLKVIKTKWYQTGIFKAIMFVVAVVVSLYTNGAGLTLYTVLYAVAQTLVIGYVLNLAIKFLVTKLDIQMGALFAIVAVVLIIAGAGAYIGDAGSIMGMTAPQLMQAANYTMLVSTNSTQLEMKKMIEAHTRYGDRMQEQFDELAKLQEELNVDSYLSPYYLMSDSVRSPDIRVGEIMNDFLIRTLSTNIGTGTTAMISNMFELTVRLPTMQETIAKMQRGTYGNTTV